MKINQEEIAAASLAYSKTAGPGSGPWSAALEAAYTVRKARKQAKRDRQRKEKDKQVVESVKPEYWQFHIKNGRVVGSSKILSKAPLTVLQLAEDEQ